MFRKKVFIKRLPILNWLPKYSADDAIGDLIAGVTVGLTVIPQALAYAGIAGLPPQGKSAKHFFDLKSGSYDEVCSLEFINTQNLSIVTTYRDLVLIDSQSLSLEFKSCRESELTKSTIIQ